MSAAKISIGIKVFKYAYLSVIGISFIALLVGLTSGNGMTGAGAIIFFSPILLALAFNAIIARVLLNPMKRKYWALVASSTMVSFPVFLAFYTLMWSDIKIAFDDGMVLVFLVLYISSCVGGGILVKIK